MFDFLKKKISGFVSGLSKKDEEEKKPTLSEPVVEQKPDIFFLRKSNIKDLILYRQDSF
jgi:hypothetical protein